MNIKNAKFGSSKSCVGFSGLDEAEVEADEERDEEEELLLFRGSGGGGLSMQLLLLKV